MLIQSLTPRSNTLDELQERMAALRSHLLSLPAKPEATEMPRRTARFRRLRRAAGVAQEQVRLKNTQQQPKPQGA